MSDATIQDWRFHQEPVRDARHALELLDDVNDLVNFCSTNMLDVPRYYRGSEAMWRVAYWLADIDAGRTTP